MKLSIIQRGAKWRLIAEPTTIERTARGLRFNLKFNGKPRPPRTIGVYGTKEEACCALGAMEARLLSDENSNN